MCLKNCCSFLLQKLYQKNGKTIDYMKYCGIFDKNNKKLHL